VPPLLQLILIALGVAASPVPVVAVLVVLLTRRARVGSVVFAAAWVLGNALAITIALAFTAFLTRPRLGPDIPFEGAVMALLGIGLVATAVVSRRGRMRSTHPESPPAWVTAVDNLSPAGGALVALSNAMTSPKNLTLALSAGLLIQKAFPPWWPEGSAAAIYVIVASTTVVTPVVVYFVMGERAEKTITRWKQNVTAHAAAVMEVVLFVLGMALAVRGALSLLG
jgi:hypothetical protein